MNKISRNTTNTRNAFVTKTKENNLPNNSNLSFKGHPFSKLTNINNFNLIEKKILNKVDKFKPLKTNLVQENFLKVSKNTQVCSFEKTHPFIETVTYPVAKMPKELFNFIANKFNIESWQNSKMLKEFNQEKELETAKRAMRGLLNTADDAISAFCKKKNIKPKELENFLEDNKNNEEFQEICKKVLDDLQKKFNANLASDTATYNTAHERTIVRLVSGFVAAAILGCDFHNKSIMNGKSEDEAMKELKGKRKQEIIENIEEAISQYLTLGAFSSFTNNHTYAAPVLNTALGVLFSTSSRLISKRPIMRVKPKAQLIERPPTMEGFISGDRTSKADIRIPEEDKSKKHLLSPKNIALACIASIGIGFGFRKLKTTKIFENLKNSLFKDIIQRYKKATVGEVFVDKKEFIDYINTLDKCGFTNTKEFYSGNNSKLAKAFKDNDKVFVGEYEKMTNTKIPMSKKELIMLPLAPLRIAKEIFSYPYKMASKALEGLNLIKKTPNKKYKDDFDFVNTILDFRKQAAKFNNNINSKEFLAHYKKHIEKNRQLALNAETKSNVNNCDIGKLTALFGIFTSLFFSGNDDYNTTYMQTGDINKAKKDARLRMINKVIRTSVQCVFLSLNNLFKTSYKTSLIAAGLVTASCTVSVDIVTRILSGMPFRKMNKEELESYNQNKKQGILKSYYNALDKLTD